MNEQSNELMNLFVQIEMLLHRQIAAGRKRGFLNPHRGQGRVLSILKLKSEITQKELNYILGMSKQALGELLNKLENCGYIIRLPSKEDGRVMVIRLTVKGKEVSSEMEDETEETEDLFQCLNDEEKKNLSSYLQRLIEEWKNSKHMDEHMRHHMEEHMRFFNR